MSNLNASTLTFEEFISQCLEPDPHLRVGQRLMTRLCLERIDLYDRIVYDDLREIDSAAGYDCFYDDAKVWGTIGWLRDHW